MKTAKIFISGFVQGVGFRRFVKKEAIKLGLTGYAKNLPDTRVEILVQGSKEQIEKLIEHCGKGTFLSEIKNITINWIESPLKFDGFEITH